MADRIQHRRDTAERWATFNPILLEGEIGYVLDNPNQYKIGDGVHAWNDLPLRGFTGNISQYTGDDENAVMSQKATTEKLSELGADIEEVKSEIEEIGRIVLPEKSWQKPSDDSIIKSYYGMTISNNGNLATDSAYAYFINVYDVEAGGRCKIVGRTYSGKTELAAFYNSDSVFDSSTLISIVPYDVTGNPTDLDQIVIVPDGAKAVAVCQYYNTGTLPYDQQLKFYIEVIGDGLLDRVESLEANTEIVANEVKNIESNLESVLGGESYNLYDASKQTPETISPHYYVNGAPYSDTSFDDKYNATNLFELQPNTEYTVCLVPSLSYVEKPWGDSPQGIFFYDKDGIYISGTSDSTFITPSETKYARFNYALVMSIPLDLLNARCMIVKGRNVPTKYEPYSKVSLEDKVEGLEKDVAENTKSIEGLNDKFSKLEDFTGGESYNLYDKSKQTSETISPHYYVDGKPYATTQFDANYNCTAMFELEQETEYTIGLVPPYGYEKPWADASQGIFFYDKDGVYISGTSESTFVTPSNTKYARFNYAIIKYITLETVNARCMIVKGSQLPSEYVPYESSNFIEKLEKLEQKIGELEVGAGVMYYEIKTDEINIFQKNGTNSDVAFVLKRKGGNNLFDFYQVLKYSNESDILETDINKYSPIITSGTDWHAPFKVVADNNADGDNKSEDGKYKDFFTGGNHQYNNNGSGSTPTAKSISLAFYADGKRIIKGDKGYASNIRMEWVNEVQGQNTTKADGTGRHILQENHVLTFDGSRFFSHVELVALEDIHINLWYGFQALYQNVFNKVRFVDTTNRGVYSLPSSANCGSTNKCKGMYLYGDGISLKMEVDDTFDLGKREFNNISYAAFAEEYGKVYFGIVYTSQFAVKTDEMYVLEGGYEFKLS